jgi:hypothetical protein
MARQAVVTLSTDKTISLGKDSKYIEGFFIGTKQAPAKLSKSGFQSVHIVKTETGNVGIWGFYTLNDSLSSVKPGTMVFITYKGKVPLKGGKTQHTVLVEQDPEITTFVPANVSSDYDNASEPEGASDEQAFGSDDVEPQFEEAEMEASDAEEEAPVYRAPPVAPKGKPNTVSADQQRRAMELLNRTRGAAKKTA